MTSDTRKGDVGGPHAGGGLLASQHAPGNRPTNGPQKSQQPTTNQDQKTITPEQVATDLKAIIKGLEEEGFESSWIAAADRKSTRLNSSHSRFRNISNNTLR